MRLEALGGGLFRALPPAALEKAWVPYAGPMGGKGWRSTNTGEVRYQASMPKESEEGQPYAEGQAWTPPVKYVKKWHYLDAGADAEAYVGKLRQDLATLPRTTEDGKYRITRNVVVQRLAQGGYRVGFREFKSGIKGKFAPQPGAPPSEQGTEKNPWYGAQEGMKAGQYYVAETAVGKRRLYRVVAAALSSGSGAGAKLLEEHPGADIVRVGEKGGEHWVYAVNVESPWEEPGGGQGPEPGTAEFVERLKTLEKKHGVRNYYDDVYEHSHVDMYDLRMSDKRDLYDAYLKLWMGVAHAKARAEGAFRSAWSLVSMWTSFDTDGVKKLRKAVEAGDPAAESISAWYREWAARTGFWRKGATRTIYRGCGIQAERIERALASGSADVLMHAADSWSASEKSAAGFAAGPASSGQGEYGKGPRVKVILQMEAGIDDVLVSTPFVGYGSEQEYVVRGRGTKARYGVRDGGTSADGYRRLVIYRVKEKAAGDAALFDLTGENDSKAGSPEYEQEPDGPETGGPALEKAWVAYTGPHGGRGWRSTLTGEVRYQEARPAESEEGPVDGPSPVKYVRDWTGAPDEHTAEALAAELIAKNRALPRATEDGRYRITRTVVVQRLPDGTFRVGVREYKSGIAGRFVPKPGPGALTPPGGMQPPKPGPGTSGGYAGPAGHDFMDAWREVWSSVKPGPLTNEDIQRMAFDSKTGNYGRWDTELIKAYFARLPPQHARLVSHVKFSEMKKSYTIAVTWPGTSEMGFNINAPVDPKGSARVVTSLTWAEETVYHETGHFVADRSWGATCDPMAVVRSALLSDLSDASPDKVRLAFRGAAAEGKVTVGSVPVDRWKRARAAVAALPPPRNVREAAAFDYVRAVAADGHFASSYGRSSCAENGRLSEDFAEAYVGWVSGMYDAYEAAAGGSDGRFAARLAYFRKWFGETPNKGRVPELIEGARNRAAGGHDG